MKKENFEFKKEYVSAVKTICNIQSTLIFTKKENNVSLLGNNEGVTIAFTLNAPEKYFNFQAKEIAILDFNRFSQFYNSVNEPILSIESDDTNPKNIIISSESGLTNIRQRLAEPSIIEKPEFEDISFIADAGTLQLSKEELSNINKMIGMISGDKNTVKINIANKTATIIVYNDRTSDRFEQTYSLYNEIDQEISYEFQCEDFIKIPNAAYKISFNIEDKSARFSQIREDEIELNIYIAESFEA